MITTTKTNILSKRTLVILSLVLLHQLSYSQSQEKTHFYLNVGGQGIETSINTKIYGDFNAEVFAGFGQGYTTYTDTNYGMNFKNPTPFVKGNVKWNFLNKEKQRLYIGVQSKYSFGHDDDLDYNKTSIHEIHFGIEQNMGKRFIINSHIGGGHLTDHVMNKSTALLTLGLTFKFNYLKF